ncbi:MAG: hypothetical protein GX916_03410 [Clostridiales bacterium]|nr:hypothetical protein [Clostridiales bacterium]
MKKLNVLLVLLLAVAIAFAGYTHSQKIDLEKEVKSLNEQVTALRAELDEAGME